MDNKPQSLLAQNARLILTTALNSEYGTEVEVAAVGDIPTPTLRAKQVLYRFKKEDSAFDCLRIFQSPLDDKLLWITKQSFDTSSFSMESNNA